MQRDLQITARNFTLNAAVEAEIQKLGMEVRFPEEMGDQGPQASSVAIAGKS